MCVCVSTVVQSRSTIVHVNNPPLGIRHRIQTMRGWDGGGDGRAKAWEEDGMEGAEGGQEGIIIIILI